MNDILETIERWRREGQRVALATLVGVEKSAPRDPGAVLAVDERGEIAGSISGGCVAPRDAPGPRADPVARMSGAICAILAAGGSSRMGEPKLLLALGDEPMLARALAAAAEYPRVVVASSAVAPYVPDEAGTTLVINDAPERGMAHSLALADAAATDRDAALVVLLADTPLVDAALVRRLVEARGDADVAYPARDGVPGHPVVFGPRVRGAIAGLPDGDTLRTLRADERWTRVELPYEDDRPFTDVDTPEDLRRLRARLEPLPPATNS